LENVRSEMVTTEQTGWIFAGDSNTGKLRQNNEDAFYCDAARGILMVIDGMGGRAAGEVAAEIARRMIRTRLERRTGTVIERIREAITLANNEIYKQSQTNPEWFGMACVLTVAIIEDDRLTVGHVGDTRLYEIQNGRIEKITRDHSPVGEQEERGQLTELDAMGHPQRNEVSRAVGVAEHSPDDNGFIEIFERPASSDSAFLLCSDGLSDLITSAQMLTVIEQRLADYTETVRQLIAAANEAGGKDNITVIYAARAQKLSATVKIDVTEPLSGNIKASQTVMTKAASVLRFALAAAAWIAAISFFTVALQ
jgi:PPM family protein phosphatase